jgi:threonylcarbamoyladenosine tRNA methylthiotransferase MtaB
VKYAVLTFGCRTNQADSLRLERDLRARGGEESAIERAGLVIVNTCAVTAAAEQAARQALRRVARLNPDARVVATGCYATRLAAQVADLPVWRVVPNAGKGSLVEDASTADQDVPGTAGSASTASALRPGVGGRTIHLLRVQTGCDEACAYCIVPLTRGRSVSVPPAEVLREVSDAGGTGFKEVTLTGVHLGAYGRELEPQASLAGLIRALGRHPADVRFRLSAVEPMDFGEDVIDALADSGRFARHFHLPLQHASDRILRAMGRPYTLDRYSATLTRLCDTFPDAAVGADVIVGFPGETEDDFEACAAYLTSSPLAYVHVFPFSPRPGTRAATLDGRLRGEEVRARVHRLREIGAQLWRQFRQRFAGSERDGLTIEDGSTVLTDNYLRVKIPAGRRRNERVRVRVMNSGEVLEGIPV